MATLKPVLGTLRHALAAAVRGIESINPPISPFLRPIPDTNTTRRVRGVRNERNAPSSSPRAVPGPENTPATMPGLETYGQERGRVRKPAHREHPTKTKRKRSFQDKCVTKCNFVTRGKITGQGGAVLLVLHKSAPTAPVVLSLAGEVLEGAAMNPPAQSWTVMGADGCTPACQVDAGGNLRLAGYLLVDGLPYAERVLFTD